MYNSCEENNREQSRTSKNSRLRLIKNGANTTRKYITEKTWYLDGKWFLSVVYGRYNLKRLNALLFYCADKVKEFMMAALIGQKRWKRRG